MTDIQFIGILLVAIAIALFMIALRVVDLAHDIENLRDELRRKQ